MVEGHALGRQLAVGRVDIVHLERDPQEPANQIVLRIIGRHDLDDDDLSAEVKHRPSAIGRGFVQVEDVTVKVPRTIQVVDKDTDGR
jgi:hypothetical protein